MELTSILRRAGELHGEDLAVACGATRFSYGTLLHEARAFAGGLLALGMEHGDRVALLHRNCHQFLRAALGAVMGGQVLVPLNIRLDAASLGLMLADSGARILLAEDRFAALASDAASRARSGVSVADPTEVAGAPPPLQAPATPSDLAQLYYTSGTTGRPRGVMLTHGNIASHALMTAAELSLTDADVWGHVAPMFHLADAWAVFAVTMVGGTHVMFPDFEPEAVLQGFVSHGVTISNLVPTMLGRLVNHPGAGDRSYGALRAILSGGAPIAPSLVEKVMATLRTDYIQTYGLTETSPYLTFSRLTRSVRARPEAERMRVRARTGRPAIGVDLEIVGSDGSPVPRDDATVGEIRVRAPWVSPGYWQRPEETAAAFQDGWFYTGDLATWDRDGYVAIVDRKKDMIITGGEKVFSVEVESCLAGHPAVLECAVVGVPDAEWGEAVCAVIHLRPGSAASQEEIDSYLRQRLAAFKVPKRFVFSSELPKTGSGKIQKAELRQKLTRAEQEA